MNRNISWGRLALPDVIPNVTLGNDQVLVFHLTNRGKPLKYAPEFWYLPQRKFRQRNHRSRQPVRFPATLAKSDNYVQLETRSFRQLK